MDEILRAENLCTADIVRTASFCVRPGDMTILMTPKDEVNIALAKILIGIERPSSGKVFLYNNDTGNLADAECRLVRRNIGIAFGNGGLVSNLKAWENLTLPLYYHQQLSRDEIEKRGIALLNRLGYDGKYMALPGHLSNSQRKLIGLARAMITDPALIMYETPVRGLSVEEKNGFYTVAREFHREKAGRASLFITSDPEVVRSLPEATVISLDRES